MTGSRISVPVAAVGALLMCTSGVAQEPKTAPRSVKAPANRTQAPDFALQDGTGKVVRLSEYRGRVVLLDFWATKCGGCVQEIPMFAEVANAYRARGLEAIGVSEDIVYENLSNAGEAWQLVRPFVRERRVPYLIVMGDSRVTADYDIKALPLTHLIDKQGRVAVTYSGIVARGNLETDLSALLAESK